MNRQDVITFAKHEMDKWGLEGWKFVISKRMTRTLGQCNYQTKTITLSLLYIDNGTEADIKDTVLHEIAHALDKIHDNGWSHGETWKKWCRKVGAKPNRTKDLEKPLPQQYQLVIEWDSGDIEEVPYYTIRRKNLKNKQVRNRPSTRNLLRWKDLKTGVLYV